MWSSSSSPGGVSSSIVSWSSSNGRAGPEEAEPRPDARDVGVDGHIPHAEAEQQHARGGLAADAGQPHEVFLGLAHRQLAEPVE